MKIQQLSSSACESIIRADGVTLRLWIVTGGTPALSIDDHSFSESYDNVVPKFRHEYWLNDQHCYAHQIVQNPIQGPTVDDLPEGEETVRKYLEKTLPLQALRTKRKAVLKELFGLRELKSPRIHDEKERSYAHLKLDLTSWYRSSVLGESRYYVGRGYAAELAQQSTMAWKRLVELMNDENLPDTWEELTEDQFNEVVEALKSVAWKF